MNNIKIHYTAKVGTFNIFFTPRKNFCTFMKDILCKDGSYRYLERKSQPNGKYIYASARDITNKCLKEKSLIRLKLGLSLRRSYVRIWKTPPSFNTWLDCLYLLNLFFKKNKPVVVFHNSLQKDDVNNQDP